MSDKASRIELREELLAGGAALVTVLLWASAFVGIRAAGEDLSPGALSLARLLVGSAALGALVLVRRAQRMEELPQVFDQQLRSLHRAPWGAPARPGRFEARLRPLGALCHRAPAAARESLSRRSPVGLPGQGVRSAHARAKGVER